MVFSLFFKKNSRTLKLTGLNYRVETALLQLHRRFFAEAMSGPEPFNLDHKYAPSVLATYLGAASLISTIETLFDHEPQLSARFLYFWFNTYSAAVSLALYIHGGLK